MSDFTYEHNDIKTPLETYEWDNTWWDHAGTEGVPRVLLIGDSISVGTRRVATATAEEKIYFDGYGTSKALDNPYFLHKNSKALVVNFALLFTSKSTAKWDCDIALTVAISRLDDAVPKVTFVDAESLLDYEGKAGASVQKLLSHIEKSFKN
jgi:hypothetical protein